MPMGSKHEETGRLDLENGNLVFRRDAGGTWRLDASRRAQELAGERVTVVGTRVDFDLLQTISVERLRSPI
ncbi:hypothetical protein E5673_08105 [Sphingomonas sp. PAMC26645]|uniref:DUF5818 domain-containing protein n=1 Tax=Sphingomonas TaxID=13687 RepID=UPI00109DF20B|nr:hypothetical protein E5673_08105 [Sphingomonas sp. PAMC26645]